MYVSKVFSLANSTNGIAKTDDSLSWVETKGTMGTLGTKGTLWTMGTQGTKQIVVYTVIPYNFLYFVIPYTGNQPCHVLLYCNIT